MERIIISVSEEETQALGVALGACLFPGAVVLLDGELGAGKTVFARGVARGLGVAVPVNSPTFTLLNVHSGRLPFYHFDLYRLEVEEELFELGIDEMIDGEGVTLVEWAGKFAGYFTVPALYIEIEAAGLAARKIVLQADTEAYENLLRELPAGGESGADTGN